MVALSEREFALYRMALRPDGIVSRVRLAERGYFVDEHGDLWVAPW